MATFKSDIVALRYPAQTVYDKLSDLEGLKSVLAHAGEADLDSEKRQALEQIKVTSDSIELPGGPVGAITLRVTERVPYSLIRLEGEGSPVPLSLSLLIAPQGEEESTAQVEIDIQIPAMLKPMVSGPLKKMTEQFAQMIRVIPFDK